MACGTVHYAVLRREDHVAKLFAGLTASVLCGTMLGTLWAASAEETDAPVKRRWNVQRV